MELDIAALYLSAAPLAEPTQSVAEREAADDSSPALGSDSLFGVVFDVPSDPGPFDDSPECLICCSLLLAPSSPSDETSTRARAIPLSCGHIYCPDCLRSLFLQARAPPKCCSASGPLGVELARPYLSEKECRAFGRVLKEWMLRGERVYCADIRTCGVFLGEREGKPRGLQCEECRGWTCASCGGVWHGRDNPCSAERDEEEALAQKLMKRQHARRCPVCRCLVSRVDGCQFVLCTCGSTFCDVCGEEAPQHICPCMESIFSIWARSVVRWAGKVKASFSRSRMLCSSGGEE